MPTFRKKKYSSHSHAKKERTGEDIDMLHQKENEPQVYEESGSSSYKDHVDGA